MVYLYKVKWGGGGGGGGYGEKESFFRIKHTSHGISILYMYYIGPILINLFSLLDPIPD